jgi:hypothetical protein
LQQLGGDVLINQQRDGDQPLMALVQHPFQKASQKAFAHDIILVDGTGLPPSHKHTRAWLTPECRWDEYVRLHIDCFSRGR